MRRLAVFGCAWLSLAASAHAQHDHDTVVEKPAALLPGMGPYQHPIATRHPEAQAFFDQGLKMLFGFNRYEALRSFRKASELDPAAVMPYWGVAMALGPHINMDMDGDHQPKEACAAVRDGMQHRAGAPPREGAYLDAVALRCRKASADGYIPAMRALARRYPDDLDAATLLAEALLIPPRWRWWRTDGVPAPGVEEVVRVLESVLRRYPDHPGANHFYIHAVEMSPSPERAIPSAQRLMAVVPGAGHLVHMPGHIWMALGDFDRAAETNERAAKVDEDYFRRTGVTGTYLGYYAHNLHFIAVARHMQGREQDARRAAEAQARAAQPHIDAMPMMADAFSSAPLFALMRFHRWDEVLKLERPHQKLVASTALWHFGRASAWARRGQRQQAQAEAAVFHQAVAKVPADWLWLNNKARHLLGVAGAVLAARLAASDEASVVHWQRAVALEDRLIYDEPPAWYHPVRESLGGALLRSGQASAAEAVFRAGLRRGPRNGRLLFGLLASLNAQDKTDAARSVEREFQSAWKAADVKLRVEDL